MCLFHIEHEAGWGINTKARSLRRMRLYDGCSTTSLTWFLNVTVSVVNLAKQGYCIQFVCLCVCVCVSVCLCFHVSALK